MNTAPGAARAGPPLKNRWIWRECCPRWRRPTPSCWYCLTLWVTNLMMAERDMAEETRRLVGCFGTLQGPVIFVSNEVGLGIVPDNAMARAFRDHAGRLHQEVAAVADAVYFLVAGIPMTVKQTDQGNIH